MVGSMMKVPPDRPGIRSTSPRLANPANACRSVIRLTPKNRATSASGGSLSPARSSAARSDSMNHRSICWCAAVPGCREMPAEPEKMSDPVTTHLPGSVRTNLSRIGAATPDGSDT
jgi:hypothetical protein